MEWRRNAFTISDNPAKLNIDVVCDLLLRSYWAADRSRAMIEESTRNSIVFGLYHDDTMIGFARVITDKAVFGWLADVIIDSDYRAKGLGTWLMECILEHPVIRQLPSLGLATKDAHGLYEKFGFHRRETMVLHRDASGEVVIR